MSSTTDPESTSNEESNQNESASSMPKLMTPEQPGIMKPDIVFFGEGLGDEFHKSVAVDKNEVRIYTCVLTSNHLK